MKRNDASRIPALSITTNQGKYVGFVSKDYPDNTTDLLFVSTIIAASDSYAGVWQNAAIQENLTRIAALDAADTNTLKEAVVVHYINEILT